jgi:hypothetical protein
MITRKNDHNARRLLSNHCSTENAMSVDRTGSVNTAKHCIIRTFHFPGRQPTQSLKHRQQGSIASSMLSWPNKSDNAPFVDAMELNGSGAFIHHGGDTFCASITDSGSERCSNTLFVVSQSQTATDKREKQWVFCCGHRL